MQYLPYFIVAGTLVMGLMGAIVTGEWLILLLVPLVAVPYVLWDRRQKEREPREEQLAAEAPDEQ